MRQFEVLWIPVVKLLGQFAHRFSSILADIRQDGLYRILYTGIGLSDFVDGFARALIRLLQDEDRRCRMGAEARDITIPYFTWQHLTTKLFENLGVSPGRGC